MNYGEYWIEIDDYPNYEVSNKGRVRNRKTGRILRQSLNKPGGYLRVGLGGKHQYVHRLVADSFYDGDHSKSDVNHIDGNKMNNQLNNLEWCSRSENIKHAYINGLKFNNRVTVVRCKYCRNRYEFDVCEGKPDSFYCALGERYTYSREDF